VVKILDMGLARFFNDDEDALTKKYDEHILGTADYLAPEQAIDSHTVDIRADVYGLGGTFFYLLTGQPPFPEGTVAQKLLWHQTREPAELRSLRPEVPAELAAVVAKMMAKDAADRYQTPAEVMAALADRVQSPIAPPADKEMPQLSPAAIGTGTVANPPRGFSGPPTVVTGPNTVSIAGTPEGGQQPAPSPNGPANVVATPKPAIPARTPATGIPPAARAPVVPRRARPRLSPDPAPAVVWEELTAETQPELKPDTERTKRHADGAAGSRSRRQRILLLTVVGGFLALGLLAGAVAYLLSDKKPPPPPTADGPATWYVSTRGGPDPDRTFTSLAAALDRAEPGEVIRILDERIEDPAPIKVSRQTGVAKGVRVEAGTPSKKVVWAPRSRSHDQGLIEIADIEDFTLSGLEFDLGGRNDYGVVVSRSCPGLTIEGVTVLHPSVAGFRFASAAGEAGRPIRVTRCRVAAKSRVGAAVELTDRTRDVVFENGRLEGPGGAAVEIDGTARCEFRNNRVFKFDRGVYLTGDPSEPGAIELTVSNNTFHTVATGVDIRPLSAALKRLTLAHNYFARTDEIASSAAAVVVGFQPAVNARDKASREGNLNADSAVVNFSYHTNPGNDAQFLLPPADKPGPTAGPNNVPVGAR
jgi:hypothetical protein